MSVDGKDAKHDARRSVLESETYKMVFITYADHLFSVHKDEMVKSVVECLKSQAQIKKGDAV